MAAVDARKPASTASPRKRYFVVRPVLSPLEASDAAAGHPSRVTWERERAAFERMLPRLEKRYTGRYVAVARGKVVDSDDDHEALYRRVWSELDGRTFYVGRVGAPPEAVDMPGFELS
jgi:hypothetical protein